MPLVQKKVTITTTKLLKDLSLHFRNIGQKASSDAWSSATAHDRKRYHSGLAEHLGTHFMPTPVWEGITGFRKKFSIHEPRDKMKL